VTELTNDYHDGGALSVHVATDAQPSDGSLDPYATQTGNDHTIELSGAPEIPGDQDFLTLWIPDSDSIDGSLDGTAGSFSCANVDGCVFRVSRAPGNHLVASSGVTFTATGGTAQPVSPRTLGTVPNADYLAIGHWLYVPDDVNNWVEYEFGVFASGGDPFEVSYLAALTGTATYLGDALGMYYVDGLSSSPTVGSFTADAQLTADFGDGSETAS